MHTVIIFYVYIKHLVVGIGLTCNIVPFSGICSGQTLVHKR